MNQATFDFMEQYFDELDPVVFYRRLFGTEILADADDYDTENYGSYALHATIVYPERGRHGQKEKVWNDLAAIPHAYGQTAYMAPVAYIGWHRVNRNARFLFALAIDLDYLQSNGMQALFHMINKIEVLPRPTFVVCSGNGVHLYYQFERPLKCYNAVSTRLSKYKTALTRLIWNSYTTKKYKTPEIESVYQCMRMPGSLTKDGGVVRVFETGTPVSTEYLDKFLTGDREQFRIGDLEHIAGTMPMILARVKYPEWYERRIVNGAPRGTWTNNRALYDWWLEKVRTESIVNHRYFAVLSLVVYAVKCGISYAEVRRDAYNLIPILDALTVEETNHFTEKDVESALNNYGQKNLKTVPRKTLEEWSAISIPVNRRNGRTRAENLEIARQIRDQNQRKKGTKWNGRKSQYEIVQTWKREHPDGRKIDCIRDTGLSKSTVYRHWAYRIEVSHKIPDPEQVRQALYELADALNSIVESVTVSEEELKKLDPEQLAELARLVAVEKSKTNTGKRHTIEDLRFFDECKKKW